MGRGGTVKAGSVEHSTLEYKSQIAFQSTEFHTIMRHGMEDEINRKIPRR